MSIRLAGMLFTLALFAFISACSFKTVYNRLDYLIPEYVEGVVTLDDALEQRLDERTVLLLRWHRNTQLKQYANWLQSLQQDVNGQLTAERLEQHIARMEQFWLALVIKLNDEMAYLLPLLDAEQRKDLFAYLDEANEEFHEDFIDRDNGERIEDYAERMIDTFENWIGELSDSQTRAVEQGASGLISTAEQRLARRLEWQQGIRDILASSDSRYDKSQRLRAFLAGFEHDPDGPIKEASGHNRQIINRLTVEMAESMTLEQKEHFTSKTGDYIRMFTELAENR